MITSLPYIIESQICFAILWMAYRLFISGGGEFRLSRFYLLLSVAVSFIIPLLAIPALRAPEAAAFNVGDIQPLFFYDRVADRAAAVNWPEVLLLWMAAAGSAALLGVMFCGLIRLWRLKRSSVTVREGDVKIVYTTKPDTAFSFFNHIFITQADMSAEELEQVVAHEIYHVKMRHSVDMVIAGAMRVVFWWNPAVWMWHRSLREVHEYQVDRAVLKGGYDHIRYIQLIIQRLTDIHPELVSGFSYSLIKKRLDMITKKTSGRLSKLRILSALPAIAALMVMFSFTAKTPDIDQIHQKETQQEVAVARNEDVPKQGKIITAYNEATGEWEKLVITRNEVAATAAVVASNPEPQTSQTVLDGDVPILKAEVMPKFQDGDLATFRNWVMERLQYPAEARENNIQGTVTLSFVITGAGDLTNVEVLSSKDKLLEDEAVRVVKSSPKWTPGSQRGRPQAVKMVLPLRFEILDKAASE